MLSQSARKKRVCTNLEPKCRAKKVCIASTQQNCITPLTHNCRTKDACLTFNMAQNRKKLNCNQKSGLITAKLKIFNSDFGKCCNLIKNHHIMISVSKRLY